MNGCLDGLVVFQEISHPLVKGFGGINSFEDIVVAFLKNRCIHFGDDIGLPVGVVAVHSIRARGLLAASARTARCLAGLQQADHRRYDAALLNKIDLPLENDWRYRVKADDKTAHHLQAAALKSFDAVYQIAVFILNFMAFGQASSLGVSMPTKTEINPARTISSISSASSARLMEASVMNRQPVLPFAPFD